METLLEKFLSGNSSPQEDKCLHAILESKEVEALFDAYASKKWNTASRTMPAKIKRRIFRRVLTQLENRMSLGQEAERHQPPFKRILLRTVGVAAGIALAVLSGYLVGRESALPSGRFEVIALNGQRSSVTLPDGTSVMLNSGSRISCSPLYNLRNRDVNLDGEAFFEVARNPDSPFTVIAGEVEVEALGTKFNVKAYGPDRMVTATLVEGKIKASACDQEEILSPAEEVSFNPETGVLEKYPAPNRNHLIPWRDNELLFSGNTLEEISSILERMYNVTVIFDDDEVKGYSYTGLVRNSSLDNILNLITATTPVESRICSDTLFFRHKEVAP